MGAPDERLFTERHTGPPIFIYYLRRKQKVETRVFNSTPPQRPLPSATAQDRIWIDKCLRARSPRGALFTRSS